MELGFDWETTAAPIAQTETGSGHLADLRIHARPNCLVTRCSAVTDPDRFVQNKCKYWRKGTNHNRCMYQKWHGLAVCDKVTLTDGTEVN